MNSTNSTVADLLDRSHAEIQADHKQQVAGQAKSQASLVDRATDQLLHQDKQQSPAPPGHDTIAEAEKPPPLSWLDRIRNGGNADTNEDGYQRERGRSLPDEQKQEEKDKGRGR